MFKPHLSLRIHEAGHAVTCVALGLPVEIVSTEILTVDGHVKHREIPLPDIIHRFIRMTGPIAQQTLDPASIKDRYFKGLLFSESYLNDPTFYATCHVRLNHLGWFRDLDECYRAILANRVQAYQHVVELAALETDVRAFLAAIPVRTEILSVAEKLGNERTLSEECLADLNARQAELAPFIPARIRAARFAASAGDASPP